MNFFKNLFSKKTESKPANPTDPASKQNFKDIIAAKVTHWEKHSNADRLRVVNLDTGEEIIFPIVCGASNFNIGDIVALALPGAVIPHSIHSEAHESFVLSKAKIRGIESQGMICAAFELGLSKEVGEGIMILKPDTKLGSEFSPEMIQ